MYLIKLIETEVEYCNYCDNGVTETTLGTWGLSVIRLDRNTAMSIAVDIFNGNKGHKIVEYTLRENPPPPEITAMMFKGDYDSEVRVTYNSTNENNVDVATYTLETGTIWSSRERLIVVINYLKDYEIAIN